MVARGLCNSSIGFLRGSVSCWRDESNQNGFNGLSFSILNAHRANGSGIFLLLIDNKFSLAHSFFASLCLRVNFLLTPGDAYRLATQDGGKMAKKK